MKHSTVLGSEIKGGKTQNCAFFTQKIPFLFHFVKMQSMLITTAYLYFVYLLFFCRWSTAYSEGDFISASIFVDVH